MATSIVDKRRVAIAFDGSKDAYRLLTWAILNVICSETDHVVLLSVVSPNTRNFPVDAAAKDRSGQQDTGRWRKRSSFGSDEHVFPGQAGLLTAQEQVNNAASCLRSASISSEHHIMVGDAKVLLPKYTKNNKVDLLIIGSRGLGTIKSVFVGSVPDRCLHESPCPVLVVRYATM